LNIAEHHFLELGETPPAATNRTRGCWYEIDVGAIRHNYLQLRRKIPVHVRVYGCLKRNGYGCGAGVVAAALAQEGIDGFAVASIADAIAIRQRGVQLPILLYPGAGLEDAASIDALGLTVTVSSVDELHWWRSVLMAARIFVKLDLGFFRAGATPSQISEILKCAADYGDVQVLGLYAHMSELPGSGPEQASLQLARMNLVLNEIQPLELRPAIVMMSSSEGVLNHPEMDFDAVDPGAMLFGISEGKEHIRPMRLRPALRAIAARLISVKHIDASLGAIPNIACMRPGMVLGVIAMGWGDGLPRQIPDGVCALVRGQRARLFGPVHLEHLRIDLSDVPGVRFGDEVVLMGKQGKERITLEELVVSWNTDQIGLYAGLRDHVPKLYV
jgi:alanine racemase